jgi:thioredoxin-dependent peroxiredoxin
MDTRSRWAGFLVLAAAVAWTAPAHAQAAADTTSPAVAAQAPDFTLPGATRYGLLKEPVRLSDFRGQTVVLAFFFKARTKG